MSTKLEPIVISGISGKYPNCEDVAELADALFTKKDLITDIPELNFSVGKIKRVEKFDAEFFNITSEHADYMDPLCRILLEKTYEAIIDSGYNPYHFKGKKVGVYIANCTSDAEIESSFRTDTKGALICERAQSFLANRISYWLGINGPSCTVNTACSSGLYALEFAYKAIKNREIEAAIVGGSNLSLAPGMIYLYKNLGITSSRCRSFDNEANGFCRSEAISAILLQKGEHARRIYAEIVNIKTNNDGYKKQTILFPSSQMQTKLIDEIYSECQIPKSEVAWVEAHGTGTRIGDYQEMKSLETLCEGRVSPLLCGCVKSNTGHTEAASGLCSIAKVIIAMETERIPPNVNFKSPQNGIQALHENKIKVITETTPWNGGYVAINNFGIGGSNAHLLLKSNQKKNNTPTTDIPYLTLISGRTEESITSITNHLKMNPLNVEFIGLLHKIHSAEIPHHVYRGYTIIRNNSVTSHYQKFTENKSLWFIYPGMGSQWSSMAKDLLQLECFNESIQECHKIMESRGFNLIEIITSEDPDIFKNIENCFIGITAMMIALTDLLEKIQIEANSFIGHSFGEIGCAYADKCITKTEALNAAYYRGIVSKEIKTTEGLMAVIGLGGDQMSTICPPSISIACYNGKNSCTVSGPTNDIKELLKQLHEKNVFIKEIFSGNIAFHSQYISTGGPIYENYLKQVIKSSKPRSIRWISTSDNGEPKHCSAAYFVNNFIKPVNFQNALKQIPKNAITLEIAPHTLFKSVLNETLSKTNVNLSLLNKNHLNPLQCLMTSLGSLYEQGVNMDLSKLYPSIEYPVSKGTPMIGPLVKWDHTKNWYVPFQKLSSEMSPSNGKLYTISYDKSEFNYLKGSIMNGVNVFPECGYLKIVWDAILEQNKNMVNSSIIFRNVNFYKKIPIPKTDLLNFAVTITRKTRSFEILLKDEIICDGYTEFQRINSIDENFSNIRLATEKDDLVLQTEDIYKELKIKGYLYEGDFQSILSCNLEGTAGKILWNNNWITFMDAMLQSLYFLKSGKNNLETVSKIEFLEINKSQHEKYCYDDKNELYFTIMENKLQAGGIRIEGVKTKTIARENYKKPILQKFEFTPYFSEKVITMKEFISILVTVLLENIFAANLRITEILGSEPEIRVISTEIDKYLKKMPFNKALISVHSSDSINLSEVTENFKIEDSFEHIQKSTHLLILSNYCENNKITSKLSHLQENCFIITREKTRSNSPFISSQTRIVAKYELENEKIFLWRKMTTHLQPYPVKLNSNSFEWIPKLQSAMNNSKNQNILLYSEYDPHSGVIGFYKCLQKEVQNSNVRCVLLLDSSGPPFTLDDPLYRNQYELNLNINVFKNGRWGTYVPFEIPFCKHITAPHVYLEIHKENGKIKLDWVQGEINVDTRQKNEDYNQLIYVYYASLPNCYDDEITSKYDKVTPYAFSGKNTHGTNVMGISLSNRVTNLLISKNAIYWNVPENWSLEEIVTLPIPYMTAFMVYLEVEKLDIKSILVQNGSTDVGQAIIKLFLERKYTVCTFEQDSKNRKFFNDEFPQVHFYDSSNETRKPKNIELLILADFDCCTSELVKSVASYGTIFYIGEKTNVKWPILENAISDGKNIQFRNLNTLIFKDIQKLTALSALFEQNIENGTIALLTSKKNRTEVPGILETLDNVILHIRSQKGKSNLKITHQAKPKFICYDENVYIICGGLGGMGFELTDWLVLRGAKKIILVSRTGNCNGHQLRQIARWQSSGIVVRITTDDITTVDGVVNLLKRANQIGNVSAIFNTTLILQDALFKNQNTDKFKIVANPKATATTHLDKISRIMCPYLKHFVVFSSIVCGYGNPGQTNYGFANSVAERICEKRTSEGLPGQSIEWAGVADVGYLKNIPINKLPRGTQLQPIRSCMQTLDKLLNTSEPLVSSFVVSDESLVEDFQTVFSKIKNILDSTTVAINSNTTLQDVGLDSIAVTETKIILEQKYNITMNTNDLLKLKLTELWELENNNQTSDYKKSLSPKTLSILKEMFANVLEIIGTQKNPLNLEPIIRIESFLHEGDINQISPRQERTIFFFPGVEGFAAVIQPLARNVDMQVLCCQYNLKDYHVKDIASKLLQEIETRLKFTNTFHLAGHSFGGLIAMEIAVMLEQKGKIGYLYLIDSSPYIVKEISRQLFITDGFLPIIIGFMRALKTDIDIQKLEKTLREFDDWDSAYKYCMESLPSDLKLNREYAKALLTMAFERNAAIQLYEPIPKKIVKSKVYFFKANQHVFDLPESHGLNEFCENTVEEYIINGNHFTMLNMTELAHYIMTLYRQTAHKNYVSKM